MDEFGVIQNNLSLALSCILVQLRIQSVAASIIREGEEGTLPTEIQEIVWDSATDLERELHSRWTLVNFTYDPDTNTATTFLLAIYNVSIYSIHLVIALGLYHNGAVLHPFEHRIWAQKVDKKWQTVDLEQGFICESNIIRAQDICLNTEQNICHFQHPETVLVYIGKGCVCFRTACNFVSVDNVYVNSKNHSNFCACNFTGITGCDFSYTSPVTSYQLFQSNYTLILDCCR